MRLDGYSAGEVATLRRLWRTDDTFVEIAAALGRSIPSIRQKARRLGLGPKHPQKMRRTLEAWDQERP